MMSESETGLGMFLFGETEGKNVWAVVNSTALEIYPLARFLFLFGLIFWT